MDKAPEDKVPEIEKKEVPQINDETGISSDYCNQFNAIVTFYRFRGINGQNGVRDIIKDHPFHMKKYAEVYSDCINVVNAKNSKSVERLNELADKMNDILKDPDLIDEDAFLKTINELYLLIYGNEDRIIK
jgi:hypothetical protein